MTKVLVVAGLIFSMLSILVVCVNQMYINERSAERAAPYTYSSCEYSGASVHCENMPKPDSERSR